MQVLVVNVSHWIGFHITNRLLNEGYEVKGIRLNDENDHLLDFFSRNSNFNLVEESVDTDTSYAIAICVEHLPPKNLEANKVIVINGEGKDTTSETIFIDVPYLFGEWMPMTKENFRRGNKIISFSSKEFLEEAIYVEEFLDYFVPGLASLPKEKEVTFSQIKKNPGKKLEKTSSVYENRPIEDEIKQIHKHFEQYQELYPKTN